MLVNMTFLTIYIVTTRWMYVGMWWNKAFCWQNIRSSSLSMVMEWHSYRSMFVSMQLVRYMKVRSICERYDDYAMMIWWWCRSCLQYTFMVARDMNEVAHAISPTFAICILYPCYWWDLRYECTVHSRLVIHNNYLHLGYYVITASTEVSLATKLSVTEVTINLHWMIVGS